MADDPKSESKPPDTPDVEAAGDGEPGAASGANEAEEAVESVERAADAVDDAAGDLEEIVDSVIETNDAKTSAEDGPVDLPDFGTNRAAADADSGISLLHDVALRVKIELGRTRMYVEDVLRLNADSVIELDKAAGDPVDIFVNDRHVARGEVLVLNENFCVRVSEIVETGETET